MAKINGMGGSITVGGTAYPVQRWSAACKSDNQDTTDTGSSGWRACIAGTKSCDLTFTAFWDGAGTLLSTTFNIGATVSASCALGDGGDTLSGSFVISDFTITNDAKSPITFECSAWSNGAITMPS